MRLFRRDPAPPPDFWMWWADAPDRIAAAIDERALDEKVVEEISRGAGAVHFAAENLDAVKTVIDAWALVLPPRRLKINFEADVDWSFRSRELGLG